MPDTGERMAVDVQQILADTTTVLIVDWPSRDVPDTLARHGYVVASADGPGETDYSAYELDGESVRVRSGGRRPERADLVYAHRPIDELPHVVAAAKALGAKAVWIQSGRTAAGAKDPQGCWLPDEEARSARQIVEDAGLTYVDAPYIGDAVRQLGGLHEEKP